MFSTLLRRFRVTGPLVVLAIVTALTVAGVPAVAGPVAETAGVPKKVVKIVKRAMGLSKKANRRARVALRTARNHDHDGQIGPAGPAGPAGPRGLRGLKGDPGQNGSNGVSVQGFPEGPGVNCIAGGSRLVAANGTEYACNGQDGDTGQQGPTGQPWTPENTLPPDATLTGQWSMTGAEDTGFGFMIQPISFPIRIPDLLPDDGDEGTGEDRAALPDTNVHVLELDDSDTDCDDGDASNGDPGPENPEAAPGHLCVFVEFRLIGAPGTITVNSARAGWEFEGADVHGATLFTDDTTTLAGGSWAVTGIAAP